MILEFESGIIPEHLFRDLGFESYLALFKQEIPILPRSILQPLGEKEARAHFKALAELDAFAASGELELSALLQHTANLPNLESLLPFLQDGTLEAFHLFELGRYLQENWTIQQLEKASPLPCRENPCQKMLSILSKQTADDFSRLKLSSAEKSLQKSLNDLSDRLSGELLAYEQTIFLKTGIKLIYPYPREISKDHENLDKILQCNLLNLIEQGDFYRTEYKLNAAVKNLLREQEKRQLDWQGLIAEKLKGINNTLTPFYKDLSAYYQLRKNRAYQYLLLSAKKAGGLTLPELTLVPRINMNQGILPELKKHAGEHYAPLDLSLEAGVNVLFGANMTGKTTVLKTLYFHLILVKFGLPVPAGALSTMFPRDVGLHLRSSGKTGSGLSGFGEEIRFFCEMSPSTAVYLVDELFHSTDPINGVALTEAFLKGLPAKDSIFICTSHYPEVLSIPGICLFKMKDIGEIPEQPDLNALLKRVPYQVEPLSPGAEKKQAVVSSAPLQIALRFPLPGTILKNLLEKLER
ncbi:MAG: hypothetical protein HOK67_01710 [Deltaproteobacteria bacterium]|nr:hypothetical protein [Deltaproteobacteria bacterium]